MPTDPFPYSLPCCSVGPPPLLAAQELRLQSKATGKKCWCLSSRLISFGKNQGDIRPDSYSAMGGKKRTRNGYGHDEEEERVRYLISPPCLPGMSLYIFR